MPLYAAFLGHQPHIGLAELSAVSEGFAIKKTIDPHIALVETPSPFPVHIDQLGSIVLLAEIFPTSDAWSSREVADRETSLLAPGGSALLKNEIPSLLAHTLPTKKRGKVTFGLRTFGLPKPLVKELYRLCKQHLKDLGRPSRYIGNEHKPAPPIALHDEGVLDKNQGCELVVLFDGDQLWVGRTLFAHNPRAYAERDIQKPVRDMTTGLLPPKLAQVMLNFGEWLVKKISDSRQQNPEKRATGKRATSNALVVYDPFSGSGVIPMEALLRGWTVLASDLSQRAVTATEKNIEWLRKTKKIFKKDVESTVWKHDATKPFNLKEPPDVIVTETSLGDPLTRRPSIRTAETLRRANERLQAAFLTNAATSCPKVPIVCLWPVWYAKEKIIPLEKTWDVIARLGYRAILPQNLPMPSHHRCSLIYRRPDQFVGREMVLLLPPK